MVPPASRPPGLVVVIVAIDLDGRLFAPRLHHRAMNQLESSPLSTLRRSVASLCNELQMQRFSAPTDSAKDHVFTAANYEASIAPTGYSHTRPAVRAGLCALWEDGKAVELLGADQDNLAPGAKPSSGGGAAVSAPCALERATSTITAEGNAAQRPALQPVDAEHLFQTAESMATRAAESLLKGPSSSSQSLDVDVRIVLFTSRSAGVSDGTQLVGRCPASTSPPSKGAGAVPPTRLGFFTSMVCINMFACDTAGAHDQGSAVRSRRIEGSIASRRRRSDGEQRSGRLRVDVECTRSLLEVAPVVLWGATSRMGAAAVEGYLGTVAAADVLQRYAVPLTTPPPPALAAPPQKESTAPPTPSPLASLAVEPSSSRAGLPTIPSRSELLPAIVQPQSPQQQQQPQPPSSTTSLSSAQQQQSVAGGLTQSTTMPKSASASDIVTLRVSSSPSRALSAAQAASGGVTEPRNPPTGDGATAAGSSSVVAAGDLPRQASSTHFSAAPSSDGSELMGQVTTSAGALYEVVENAPPPPTPGPASSLGGGGDAGSVGASSGQRHSDPWDEVLSPS